MASSPEDITSSDRQSASSKSAHESLDDLIDLLLEPEAVKQDLEQNTNLEQTAELSDTFAPSESPQFTNIDAPDLDVAVEQEVAQNPTLNEAVAYEAFLRQTVDSHDDAAATPQIEDIAAEFSAQPVMAAKTDEKTDLPATVNQPQSLSKSNTTLSEVQQTLATENYTVEDLADSINALIPLIVELLSSRVHESRETILHAVAPIIDRIIEQRFTDDAEKMAVAIAKILPHAITEEINLSPQAIAKAIAPEIALAIREQILLDKDAISDALASEMGRAIKTQIELEKDAMVDALYPVIGNTISKYMVELVKDINRKVENTLNPEGIKRKIRARIQGVSEAELILQEAVGYQVQAVFLIDKDSGLVIQEVQTENSAHLESDLVAGMLTAIRSFANDCITSGSELDVIDYGDWQIPIEVAGYCYLAVVVKGEPSKQFRAKTRAVFSEIVLKYGDEIQDFCGNPTTVPEGIAPLLEELIVIDGLKPEADSKSSGLILLWVLAIILGLILIPWGIIHYRGSVAHRIEQQAAVSLDAAPELSVYRLDSEVSRGKLTLTGRVPSPFLRDRAAKVVQPLADQSNLQLENQVLAVDVPVEPSSTVAEIQRLTSVLNQQSDIAIKTIYENRQLTVQGFMLNNRELRSISSSFEQIPGVDRLVMAVERQLPSLNSRFYFQINSVRLRGNSKYSSKIKAIKQFLEQYPQLNLRLIAHSDRLGSRRRNQQLGKERVRKIKQEIVALGVNPARLELDVSEQRPPDVEENQPSWLSRCVRIEPFIPPN